MNERFRTLLGTTAVFMAFLALVRPAPGFVGLLQDDDEQETGESEESDDEEAAEDEDRYLAIVGGDVYTGTGAVLRRATILSHNGVIEEIDHDPYLPEGTEIVDATGMRVYPGLVALGAASHVTGGLFSSGGPADDHEHDPHFGLDDAGDEDSDPHEKAVRDLLGHFGDDYAPPMQAEIEGGVADTFDPFSQYMVLALAAGITTAEQSNSAVKLKRGEIDDVVMKEKNLVTIVWSVSSPSSIRSTREKFAKASAYLRKLRVWEDLSRKEQKEKKEPSKKGVDSNTVKILRGDVLASFNANDREDLLGIARFAQEYHFRPVIQGCREGWTVAEELGRAGAIAIVTPRDRQPKDETLVRPGGSSIENAATLSAAGVQIAIRPGDTSINLSGIAGRDLLHLPIEAAFGVRGGLSEEAALASITIVPARILGVDHRIGTLEVGKDMDAIVTDGDVLHYETFVQFAVVDGKQVYDKQEELFFSHIRPRQPPEPSESAPVPVPVPVPDQEADQTDDGKGEEEEDEGAEEEDEGFEEEDEDGGDRAR